MRTVGVKGTILDEETRTGLGVSVFDYYSWSGVNHGLVLTNFHTYLPTHLPTYLSIYYLPTYLHPIYLPTPSLSFILPVLRTPGWTL